jgi:hypothetical protein
VDEQVRCKHTVIAQDCTCYLLHVHMYLCENDKNGWLSKAHCTSVYNNSMISRLCMLMDLHTIKTNQLRMLKTLEAPCIQTPLNSYALVHLCRKRATY